MSNSSENVTEDQQQPGIPRLCGNRGGTFKPGRRGERRATIKNSAANNLNNFLPLFSHLAIHSLAGRIHPMIGAPLNRLMAVMAVLTAVSAAQQAATSSSASASGSSASSSTATCSLEDGKELYVRYNAIPASKERIVNGKPFTPGGSPMTLFTETKLGFGNSTIPVGAYSLYAIPGKDHWTLVVNKNVTAGSAYDERQDLARGPMETAQVSEPGSTLDIAFAHVGARCTLRIYFGKSASFADFMEK